MAENNGKIRNSRILNLINTEFENILNGANTNSTQFTNDTVEKNGVRIKTEDEEKYDAIVKLKNYLEHKSMIPESTYVIPGVEYYEGGRKVLGVISLPKSDAQKLAEEAEDFERLLGIKFPAQVYQLKSKYRDSKVPGYDMPIPEPRLLSETNEEYENRLKATYETVNHTADLIADTEIRSPYPHERVNYRENDELNNNYESDYYQYYRFHATRRNTQQQTQGQDNTQTQATGSPDTHPGQNNDNNPPHPTLNENEPQIVTESEDYDRTPLWQRIGGFLHRSGSTIKNPGNHQKLKVLALLGAGTAGGIALFLNPATQPVAIAAIGVGAIYAGIKGAKKLADKKIAPKLRDLFFGKRREEPAQQQTQGQQPTPTRQPNPVPTQTQTQGQPSQQQTQGQPQPQPTPTPTGDQQTGNPPAPQDNFTDIPQRLEDFLNAMNIEMPDLRETRAAIINLQDEIRTLEQIDPNSPQLPLKYGELQHLTNNFKNLLQMISERTREMMEELNQEQVLSNEGGRTHGSH